MCVLCLLLYRNVCSEALNFVDKEEEAEHRSAENKNKKSIPFPRLKFGNLVLKWMRLCLVLLETHENKNCEKIYIFVDPEPKFWPSSI